MNQIIKQLKEKFDNASVQISSNQNGNGSALKYYIGVYGLMFAESPNIISILNDGKYLNSKLKNDDFGNYNRPYDEFATDDLDDDYTEEDLTTFDNVAIQSTMINLYNHFKETNDCYIIRNDIFPIFVADHLLIFYDWFDEDLYVLQDSEYLREDVKACVVDDRSDKSIRTVSYITHDNMGFNKTKIQVTNQEADLKKLYNDDLPDEEIFAFLNGNQSGLLLLHGEAGTGKTSYIRNMMYRLKQHEFLVLDNSVFGYITDASFIKLLMSNKNSVIILEDCEEMLADRVAGNSRIAALLNLSDGILGDSFRFKFICTFNTSVSQIDQALLRKGRMKMKYEFKKLCAEKTYALGQEIGKNIPKDESLTLADIFNYGIDNGNKNVKKQIGFGQK